MNQAIITFICNKFNIETVLATASDMCLSTKREEKVIEIVEEVQGEVYYSGTGAMVYQKEENFKNRGIVLKYSDFRSFEYQQLWGAFESNVSILDYLMNCGYKWENVMEFQNSK